MEELRKLEGLDRFMLVALAFFLVDLPQMAGYASLVGAWIAWIWGIVGAIIFGFIINMSFDVGMFLPRQGLRRGLPFLLAEFIPFLGVLSFLSVGIFVVSIFHNKSVDRKLKEREEAGYTT